MKQYVKQNTHWSHERIREVEVQLQGSGGVYYVDAVAVTEAAEEASEYQSAIAQVVQTNDYSPFGAPLAGRTYKPIDENGKIELVKVTFDSGTDGWVSNGATLGNSQGRLQLLTYNAAAQSAQKTYTNLLTIGKKYRVSFDFVIDGITTASFTINNGSTQVRNKITTITTKEVTEFTATATNLSLLATLSAGNYGRLAHIDNLVIEEIFEVGEGYRFGFNGKENDDETYGTGNALDFGARIYDSRLGRWLSVDPEVRKYPYISPYNFAGNSPITVVDPNGGDNVIYLVVLPDANGIVNMSDAQKIADIANKNFETMGVASRVVVVDTRGPMQPSFDVKNMDKNDALAVIGGTARSTSDFMLKVDPTSSFARDVSRSKGPGTWHSDVPGEINPEKSDISGNKIMINAGDLVQFAKKVNGGINEVAAILINHGRGHNAGYGSSGNAKGIPPPNHAEKDEGSDIMQKGDDMIDNGILGITSKGGNTKYSNYLNMQYGTTFKDNYSENAKKNEGIKLFNTTPPAGK